VIGSPRGRFRRPRPELGLVLLVPLLLGMKDPEAALFEGARVAVKVKPLGRDVFLAEEIEVRKAGGRREELRGVIESVDPSARLLRVLGFSVACSESTRIGREPEDEIGFEELRPGLRVRVEGSVGEDGIFWAREVLVRERQYAERKIVGTIESVGRGFRGAPVFRLLRRTVLVSEETELVGPSGRPRPLLPRRVGELDDEDVVLRAVPGLGRRVALGGEIRLRSEWIGNPDLDGQTRDDSILPQAFAVAGAGFDLGPVFAYVELQGQKDFSLEGGPGLARTGPSGDLFVAQAYVEATPRGLPWLSIALGRQKFKDERQWYFFSKNLDAVRVLADFWPVTVDVSLSRDLFDERRNVPDQERTNRIAVVGWSARPDLRLEAYFVDRKDRTVRSDSPRLLGLRVLADPGRHLQVWADLVREGGSRGRFDSLSGRWFVRPVRAHAFDAGLTYRPRIRFDPSFTVGFALGSGDGSDGLAPSLQPASADRTFRQSGLERNRDSWNGVVSFRYYGEVFDPELSNLRILTLGAGTRPLRSFSADLVYHRYEQDRPVPRLHHVGIDEDPKGADRRLGEEWDLAIGFEPDRRLELRLTAGRFQPGPAFEAGLSPASAIRFQTKFRF